MYGRIMSHDEFRTKECKEIPGYEGLYYITRDGLVMRQKNLRLISSKNGYVSLRKDGNNIGYKLEEIVYTLFVDPEWDHIHKINHIDGDASNCSADNLTCKSMIPDLPGEIWKEFATKYEVSSYGRVRYVKDDVLCNLLRTNENCMFLVSLDSKCYRLDDLVATVFLGREDNQGVYHKDGNMENCCLDNLSLEFCLESEPGEIWKDVEGFEGKYKVSSFGKIYSLPRKDYRGDQLVTKGGYFLKPSEDEDGYLKVILVNTDRKWSVFLHRVVALTFVDNPCPDVYDCINHIDGNKQNNHADNLEWCTNQMNVDHAIRTGLNSKVAYNNPLAYPTIVETSDGVRHRFESIQQASYYLGVDPELLRLYVHGQKSSCKNLDPTVNVYTTTKDDFDDVVCEPMLMYMSNSCR